MPTPRTLQEFGTAVQNELREQIHTALPATVVAYYPPTATSPATADLEIMVNRPMVDLVTGDVSYETFPQIPQVPIALPRGGGFVMSFPLAVGDEVSFVCTMYDFDAWRSTGQISSPVDITAHGLQGWAFPCITQDNKPLADFAAAAAGLVVGVDGKPGQIRIPTGGGEVDIGASPTGFVAIAGLVDQAVSTIVSAFNAHTHAFTGTTASSCTAGGATGTCTGTVTATSGPVTPAPASTAATVAKAQ